MAELWKLFVSFVRIGTVTFGGGYAMMPILQREVVESRGWATEAEILDYYAMAQCLPGIIMINTSIFIGRKHRGVAGGVVAALGAVFPSLIVITLIASFLTAFSAVPAVNNAFAGIRVCVLVLVFDAVMKLWKKSVVDACCLVIFLLVCLGSFFTEISPIAFVVAAAAAGIFIKIREGGTK
jgi:chromate transporter